MLRFCPEAVTEVSRWDRARPELRQKSIGLTSAEALDLIGLRSRRPVPEAPASCGPLIGSSSLESAPPRSPGDAEESGCCSGISEPWFGRRVPPPRRPRRLRLDCSSSATSWVLSPTSNEHAPSSRWSDPRTIQDVDCWCPHLGEAGDLALLLERSRAYCLCTASESLAEWRARPFEPPSREPTASPQG